MPAPRLPPAAPTRRSGAEHERTHAAAGTAPALTRPAVPAETLLAELTRTADGAEQIARGAERAHHEVTAILNDPVGQRVLDRLLITPETVRDNPELLKSFDVYITPDGRQAHIDLTQSNRVFSDPSMDQVETLRRRLKEYLSEYEGLHVTASIAGANAEQADIRALTYSDQVQSWFVVPIGVFLVLLVALRDPWSCFNLVATMVLTYAFALGATHLLFVTALVQRAWTGKFLTFSSCCSSPSESITTSSS